MGDKSSQTWINYDKYSKKEKKPSIIVHYLSKYDLFCT
jgi:hypothetical protein